MPIPPTQFASGVPCPTDRRWGAAARVYRCKTLAWYDSFLNNPTLLSLVTAKYAYVESQGTKDYLRPFGVRLDATLVCHMPRKTEGITFEECERRYPDEPPMFKIVLRGQILGYAEPAD